MNDDKCEWKPEKHDGKQCPIHNGNFDEVNLDEIIEDVEMEFLIGKEIKNLTKNFNAFKNEKIAKETFINIFKDFKKVLKGKLGKVEITSARTLRLTNPIVFDGIDDGVAGFCFVENGKINLYYLTQAYVDRYGKTPEQNLKGLMAHEMGHAVDIASNGKIYTQEIMKLFEENKKHPISEYDVENKNEFIAECFAFHYANPNEMSEKVFKEIKKIL